MSTVLIRLQFMKIVQDMKICKGPDSMKACDRASQESFLIAAAGIWPCNGGHISSLAPCWSTVAFIQALINAMQFSLPDILAHKSWLHLTKSSRSGCYCLLH